MHIHTLDGVSRTKLLHGPAHVGRTGRQPTTPEAWNQVHSVTVKDSREFTRESPEDGSVTHSTWTVRVSLAAAAGWPALLLTLEKSSISEQQQGLVGIARKATRSFGAFCDHFGFYAGTIHVMRFGPLY